MDVSGAYTAGYTAGLKGVLFNSNHSSDSSVQASYASGYNTGKALYTPAFTAGYKDAAKGSAPNTFYSANKAVQAAYNAGYYSLTQTNKIMISSALEWFVRGSSGQTSITSIAFDSDNNIIFAGNYFQTTTLFNRDGSTFKALGNPANWAFFLAKYDPTGKGIWVITYDGAGNQDIPYKIQVDSADNILIAGQYTGSITIRNADGTTYQTFTNADTGNNTDDSFLIKYNSSGTAQWHLRSTGSNVTDSIMAFDVDSTNNVYLALYYSTAITMTTSASANTLALTNSGGGVDTVLIKYSSSGIYQWNARIAGSGIDRTSEIKVDYKDNVYITGIYSANTTIFNSSNVSFKTLTNAGSNDGYIIKYDASGTPQWAARIGGTSSDVPLSVGVDYHNNPYVYGNHSGTISFYNASDVVYGTTITSLGLNDHFIIKYNESGTIQWINRIGGTAEETNESAAFQAYSKIAFDRFNNIYVANTFASGTLIFYHASNLSSAVTTLTNTASRNGYLVKYSSAGNVSYVHKTGNSSTNSTYNTTVAVDSANQVYVGASNVGGTFLFFNSSQASTGNGLASNNMYIIKYNQRDTITKAAYDAGYAARIAGSAQNTSYSAVQDDQAAYNAGYENAANQSTEFYYMGFNDAFRHKSLDPTVSANATLQASYAAGFAAGQAAYKVAYGAGYTDATQGRTRNTSYSASDISSNEIGPKQGAYDMGYYAYQNATNFHTFSFDWFTKTGNSTNTEGGRLVAIDTDSNIYHAGIYNTGNAPVTMNNGTVLTTITGAPADSAYIIKQTPAGALLQALRLQTGSAMNIYAINVDSQRFIYVVGSIAANIEIYNNVTGNYLGTIPFYGYSGTFVAKLTPQGVLVWSTRITAGSAVQNISFSSDNSVYVGFSYGSTVNVYDKTYSASVKSLAVIGGASDWGLVKFTGDGTFSWAIRLGSGANYEYANATSVDPEGNIYIAGDTGPTSTGSVIFYNNNNTATTLYSDSGNTFEDGLLVKVSKAGEFLWYKRWNSGPQDYFYHVVADNSSNVIVSGASDGGARITTKYDKNGTQLWTKSGGSNYFEVQEVDRENNIYTIIGNTLNKFDPSGNLLATFIHGITSRSSILIDNNNNIYMMGSIIASATVTGLDSSGNTAYTASSGSASTSDSILVKYIQRNNVISPAYTAGYNAYEAGANQNTSYSAILETQAAYDAGYSAASASHYNAGYSDGVKGYGQATAYSASEVKQARYNAGYSAGSALFSAAFTQGYKDGSRSRGKRTYSSNQYVQSAYEQGYEWYFSAVQAPTVKSDWFTRTASTGADSADAVAKDSRNNIYYGGYIGNATGTVFNKFGVSFPTTLTSSTQTAFIVKQTEDGAVLWATRFGSTAICRITGIVCDKDDNVYSYGIFTGTLTAYRNNATAYPKTLVALSANGAAFLIKQSPDGAIVWLTSITPATTVGTINPAAIAYDNQQNSIYVNGSYQMDSAIVYNANGTIGASLSTSLGTFTPTSIANCVAWFDAADFGGLASGTTVDRWLDKSGMNNHANRAGTVTVAATRQNGHPFLSVNRGFSLTTPALFPTGSTGQTLFVVVNTAPSTNSDTPFGFGDEVFGWSGDGTFYCNFGYSSRLATGVSYTGLLIHSAVANRSNATVLFKNGTQAYTNTYSTRNVNQGFTIGNNQFGYVGSIYEIIAFNRTLTLSEQQQVEGYLAWKWGLQGNLPGAHPYKTAYPGTSGTVTYDTFLAKYNVDGTEEWVGRIAGTSVDNARTIATDGAGSVYQIADTSGVAIIYDLSNNNAGSVTSAGSSDVIISKYTAAGTASLFGRISSTGADIAYSATVDTSNNLCIVGRYGGLLTFYDASGSAYGTQLSTIGGAADGFMAKYNAAGAVQLVSRLGGAGTDFAVSIATDKENNQYLLATAGTNVGLYNSNLALSIPSPIDNLGTSSQEALKAVYATRKVRSAYTGPLFKVRRSSDNVELDFYSDMFGVYTENANGTGQTLTAWLNGATAFIRTWYDQSKYANHATQTVAASQPIFDLTNKYMDFKTNRFMALPDGAVPGNNSKYTITYKHNSIPVQTGFSPILSSGNYVSNQAIILTLVNVANGGVLYYRDDWRANSTEFLGYAIGNTFTATYDQSNARSYLNGTLAQTIAKSGQSNPSTNNYIGYVPGSGSYMNGEIYYLSIFDNVLSDTDRLIVENNTIATVNSPAATLANASSYSILAKYNAAGGLLWSNIVSTNFSTQGSKYLTIDDNYNIYVAGSATGTAIIDSAGATTYTLTNAGSTDAVLIQYRQRNDTLAAYNAGTAAYNAGSSLNTSYSADTRIQAAYAAGYAYNYEYYYYAGYNTAFKNMVANTTFSSNATYQATYNAGHAAGVTAYKAAYTAGYKDAQLNLARNTAYGASSNLYEAGPKQAGYDDGYYTQKNGLLGPTLVYDWQTRIGNTTNSETATSVAVDADNNIWSIGNYTGAAAVRDSLGNTIFTIPASAAQGGFIIKQSPTGTVLNAYYLATATGLSMQYIGITTDNKIYIAGNYQANINIFNAITNTLIDTIQYLNGSGQDCFITRLGQEGVVEWTCRIRGIDTHGINQGCIDREDNIIVCLTYGAYGANVCDKNDNVIFSLASNNVNGDSGFVKISADGIPQWGGYSNGIGGDNLYAIAAGFDGSIYICGSSAGSNLTMVNTTPSQSSVSLAGGNDTFFFSVSKNGIFKWVINGTQFNGGNIAADNSNNVIVYSNFWGTPKLFKYSAAGGQLWSIDTTSAIGAIITDKNNDIYCIRGTSVLKLSSGGTILYSATYGFNTTNRLFLDNTNSIYLVGSVTTSSTTAGFDSFGANAFTTTSGSGSTSDSIFVKYRQKTGAAYPTYYTAGFTSYSAATYTASYSADAEIQATYDAGYQVAAESFVVYYNAGIADAVAGSSINNAYSTDAAIQTAYSNGYNAYTTAYNDGFTAGSSGSPSNNTYTSNATLSARYVAGYAAGVESVAVIVVTDAKRSVATLQINRASSLESSVVALANTSGLDASGNFQPSSAPYISSATSAKGFTTTLADKLLTLETTYTPRTYVDQRISTIVNAAPAALNTLREIADSLANNPSFYSTIITSTIAEQDRSVSSITGLSTLNATRAETAATQQGLIRTDISGEITRAINTEASISTSITNQTSLRIAEISSINQTLQSHINLATATDGLLSTSINAQTSQREADVAGLNNSDLAPINSTITSINLKTDNKISTSIANLSTISSNLYSETTRASTIISTIEAITVAHSSTSIGEDSTIRISLDTYVADISSNIGTEISRATGVETGLSTLIGTETERGISTLTSLSTILNTEVGRAAQAEQDISGAVRTLLNAEINRATTAEQGLSTALGLETVRATTAEGTLTTAITLETVTADAAEQDISGALHTLLTVEIGRATTAEQAISTAIGLETARATTAETGLTSSITGETVRATASMSTISAAISTLVYNELTRATTATQDISSNLASEISRATTAETGLTSSITGETARATASMSTISAAISTLIYNEQTRATTATQDISSNLTAEAQRSISTINALTSTLTAEQTRATASIADISGTLRSLISAEQSRSETTIADISGRLLSEISRATTAESGLTTTINSVQDILSTLTASIDAEANGAAKGFTGYYIAGKSTIKSAIESLDSQLHSTTTTYASLTYVDGRISTFIAGASSILNTLVEINTALNNDPVFASTLISTIAVEEARATAAELDISSNISTNVARAISAESVITSSLTAETSRSQTSIADISANIYSAISTASALSINAELDISANIGSETSRSISAISTITASLNTEISRATQAEQDISGALHALIDTERTRAINAEIDISANLSTAIARAVSAESVLTSTLNAEISRATTAEQDISGALRTLISAEQTRATTIEESISTAITSEETRAIAAENAISSTIGNETVRSIAAIADISGSIRPLIPIEEARSIAAVSLISTAITNETSRAQGAETTISGNISVEITRATGVEEDISGAIRELIVNLTARATTAEADISGRVTDEISRAIAAEQGVTSTLAGIYIVRAGYSGQSTINTVGTLSTGVWQATTMDISYGGTGLTSYTRGDILCGTDAGSVEKLSIGTASYPLKVESGTASWTLQDSSSVVLTNAANFDGASNLQQALNFLYANTKTRKVIDHVVTNAADYNDPAVPNANYVLGRVHFINYDASNTIIYLPPKHQNVNYSDGTVYRLVHNGEIGDNNFIIRYRSGTINQAGTTITGTTYTIAEMAPRDSMCFIWDEDTQTYRYAIGI